MPTSPNDKQIFYLPSELRKWVKVHAAEQDTDISQIIVRALEQYRAHVQRHEEKPTSPQRRQ